MTLHELPQVPTGREYREGTVPEAVANLMKALFSGHKMTAFEATHQTLADVLPFVARPNGKASVPTSQVPHQSTEQA